MNHLVLRIVHIIWENFVYSFMNGQKLCLLRYFSMNGLVLTVTAWKAHQMFTVSCFYVSPCPRANRILKMFFLSVAMYINYSKSRCRVPRHGLANTLILSQPSQYP